jgi:hypothetical protein
MRRFILFLVVIVALIVVTTALKAWAQNEVRLDEARIFIEYNSSDNDLGFHVFLDGEDWKSLKIVNYGLRGCHASLAS